MYALVGGGGRGGGKGGGGRSKDEINLFVWPNFRGVTVHRVCVTMALNTAYRLQS